MARMMTFFRGYWYALYKSSETERYRITSQNRPLLWRLLHTAQLLLRNVATIILVDVSIARKHDDEECHFAQHIFVQPR